MCDSPPGNAIQTADLRSGPIASAPGFVDGETPTDGKITNMNTIKNKRTTTALCFLVVVSACPSSVRAGEESSTPDHATNIVARHEGVWTAPPRRVPSSTVSDAPLLGNGDIGVLIGGGPEKQRFFISKCDFWRPQPDFPWFSPALLGAIDLDIPALKGAGYKAVQDIAKAEVRHTFTQPDGTVELRSWTPATGHELIVEISCTGRPVEIVASPWTYFGNGASVETGKDGDVTWLTRSFTGPGYDWDSQATMAVSMEGSNAGTVPPAERVAAQLPAERLPIFIGGRQLLNAEKQQYSKPFEGHVHALDLYDRVLSDEEIASVQQGGAIDAKPMFSTRHSNAGGMELSQDTIDGVSLGEVALAPTSFTMVLDVTPAIASGRIMHIGDPGKGVVISQAQHRSGYHLQVRARGRSVSSLENLAPHERILAVVTSDPRTTLLHLKGKASGTRRIDGTPRTLTLQPGKTVRLVAAARTNQETSVFQATAIHDARSFDERAVAKSLEEHRRWWTSFWNESSVEISDPVLEGYYYGSFSIMACCSRNKDFAPPLFGNWASSDHPGMGGDYHMNYNHQGPWWGCYAANHIKLTDPYDTPVLQFMDRGKYMAEKYLGRKGVYYCVGIGPKGSCACWCNPHDGWTDDSPANHFFAGQKCNALFGGINMAMRWNATLDPDYARRVYPYLREVVNFWEDDLVWEDGRYSLVRDNIHEGSPAPSGEKNNPMSLGLLRSCLKATLDMSRELGVDADEREKWRHILDYLSDFTVFERNGKKVFRYSEEGRDFATINGVGLQHVYPADAIGLESSPQMLEITRNSIEQHPQCWKCINHTMSFYPGLARAGYDPDAILKGLHAVIEESGYPNFVIDRWGGGIETCSTVTATINEMLLQSHQDVLHVFANWPKDKDARFHTLRGYGAFLVSAEQQGGTVRNVSILSERGKPCTLRNPWPGKQVRLTRNGKPAEELDGDLLKVTTGTGEIIEFMPQEAGGVSRPLSR
jgi:alpha-L-fucosidase 2